MPNVYKPERKFMRAAYLVLRTQMCPIHYARLAELAFEHLKADKSNFDWPKQQERLREKSRFRSYFSDVFYTSKPLCLMLLKFWFVGNQLPLFNADSIKIPVNTQSTYLGEREAELRFPYMAYKGGRATNQQLLDTAKKGFVLERNVVDWLKKNWPDLIFDADNHNNFKTGCNHDFKVLCPVTDVVYKIDVQGPNFRGKYNSPAGKPKADYHMQCKKVDNEIIIIESLCTGNTLKKASNILPIENISPLRFIVWLNCLKYKIPYREIIRRML